MKSLLKVYVGILGAELFCLILMSAAAAFVFRMYGQAQWGWLPVYTGTAVTILVLIPLGYAADQKHKQRIIKEKNELTVQFSDCDRERTRAINFIRVFANGHGVREVLKNAAGQYLAALREAEAAARGQTNGGHELPLHDLPAIELVLSDARGKFQFAKVKQREFEELRIRAQEEGFKPCAELDELLTELRSGACLVGTFS